MPLLNSQSLTNLRGEVEFRKKLAVQHVTGETLVPGYYEKEKHDDILYSRLETTARSLHQLVKQGVQISPFIELGAERCQRSLVLTNDYSAKGFAVDISFHQLKTAEYFSTLFNRPKLPFRVCCDVNQLPFRSNVFPFGFCYQFLHHFPSPKPILAQAHRVLSDGHFFFDDEPFVTPKLVLYERQPDFDTKVAVRKNKLWQLLERFISEEYCVERDYGILENDDIPIKTWLNAVSIFDEQDIHLNSLQRRVRSRLHKRVTWKNWLNLLLGGVISGTFRKYGPSSSPDHLNNHSHPSANSDHFSDPRAASANLTNADLTHFLVCPNCASHAQSPEEVDQQPLLRSGKNYLECTTCGSRYPFIDDILILLPTALFQELYPEFAQQVPLASR